MKVRFFVLAILAIWVFGCSFVSQSTGTDEGNEVRGDSKGAVSVIFYSGKNYTGSSFTFNVTISNLPAFPAGFTPSSFKAMGCKVLFFSHENFRPSETKQFYENNDVPDMDANGKNFAGKAKSAVFILSGGPKATQEVAFLCSNPTNGVSPDNLDEVRRYISADQDLGSDVPLAANRYLRGPWEEFIIEFLDPECMVFAIKAKSNNKYVCADRDKMSQYGGYIPMLANRTEIRLWEMFYFLPYNLFNPRKGIIQNMEKVQIHAMACTLPARMTVENRFNSDKVMTAEAGSKPYADDWLWVQNLKPSVVFDKPLFPHPYSADPSVHVFDNKLFIYCSHDVDEAARAGAPDCYAMKDYYVYSLDSINSPVKMYYEFGTEPDGIAKPSLKLANIPWAKKMLWAPDCEKKDSTYYFYFPAIATNQVNGYDVFRIGVATGNAPQGPFTAEANFIQGTFSIDPSVFNDNGTYYLIWGGTWGGQLQNWVTNANGDWYFDPSIPAPEYKTSNSNDCRGPVIAKLSSDMKTLAEKPREIVLRFPERNGYRRLKYADVDYAYFEGPWLNKVNGKYYLSYSTGFSGKIVLAEGNNIYGPYNVKKILLDHPGDMNICWTTHHSILNFNGKWYLFYQYSDISGISHKRNLRFREIVFP